MINKGGSECLNESDEHPLEHALTSKGGFLESDCDEQVSATVFRVTRNTAKFCGSFHPMVQTEFWKVLF